ncbi:MFS family permease [Salinibacter ruber]|uniref:MFS transporter n=1 Tax=Salinibacter ruber TaxID=146919 RepID=UPI00216A72A5|nr:MFS transporter [Salinibacter ruber]MCS4162606.1 MFS family permease [Salinibacter ruber]
MTPPKDSSSRSSSKSSSGNPVVSSFLVRRSPVYYGWVVLAMSTLGMAATLPGQTAGVSLFIDSFIEDVGLSRSLVSWLYTAATVLGSLALPLMGRLVDQWGPRRMATLAVGLFALSCAGMGQAGGWIGVFVGFVCLRCFGQGTLGLINNHAVNLWFERRRGLAVGILGLGMAGATALFPPLIEEGIQAYGWQRTYLIMGGILAGAVLPLGALLYRDAPERYGLSPDRENAASETEAPESEASETGVPETSGLKDPELEASGPEGSGPETGAASEDEGETPGKDRGEIQDENQGESQGASAVGGIEPGVAYRTRTFWLFTGAGVYAAGLGTGLLFHHFSILEEAGVGRDLAAEFFIPLGALTAALNVGTGWLVDRYPPRLLLAAELVLYGALTGLLPWADTTAEVWAYGSVFGVAQGMHQALLGSVYAYYFGRLHHGTIRGLANTVFIGGTAIGPALLAVGPDFLGGFAAILWILTPVPFLLGAAAFAGWAAGWDAATLQRAC